VENYGVDGNHIYEAGWMSGLRIQDITNPMAPVEVANSDQTDLQFTSVSDVAVLTPQPEVGGKHTYAYIVGGRPGRIFCKSPIYNPNAPVHLGYTSGSSLTQAVNAVAVRQASSGAPVYAFVTEDAWYDNSGSGLHMGACAFLM